MLRGQRDNQVNIVLKRAVELSRIPGQGQRESGAGRGGAWQEDLGTTMDDDGNAIHPFMLDLDSLDDTGAQLT